MALSPPDQPRTRPASIAGTKSAVDTASPARSRTQLKYRRLCSGTTIGLVCALLACDAGVPAQPTPTQMQPPAPAAVEVPANAVAAAVATPIDTEMESPASTGTATASIAPLSSGAHIEDERNTINVFQAMAPATVFVTQKTRVIDRYSLRTAEIPAGAGTGFVWDRRGYIVTNCHVAMQDCQRGIPPSNLSVTLFDRKDYQAQIIGIDRYHDIAVLKIDPGNTQLVEIKRPDRGYLLEVGQKAVAIGNPFGLDHTLTVGVVSALGREVKGVGGVTIRGMVQTDAAINPGNSGGPLLDSRGQLIGMNTMIFSNSGSSAGIGFAVPVGTVERVVPQIITTGGPERVGLGVEAFEDELARRFGIEGVMVQRVTPNTPAARAGLRNAQDRSSGLPILDVIVAVDGTKIRSLDELYVALRDKSEGDEVVVALRRFPEDTIVETKVGLIKLKNR